MEIKIFILQDGHNSFMAKLIDIEQGSFPHPNPMLSGVYTKYFIGEGEDLYGTIRYEMVPDAVIVHILPTTGVTKSKLFALREVNDILMKEVLQKKWKYEDVYITTHNSFLTKFLSRNKAQKVGEVEGMPK